MYRISHGQKHKNLSKKPQRNLNATHELNHLQTIFYSYRATTFIFLLEQIQRAAYQQSSSLLASRESQEVSLYTTAVGSGSDFVGLRALLNTLVLLANFLDAGSTGSRDHGDVSEIAVDANEICFDGVGTEVGDDDISWST